MGIHQILMRIVKYMSMNYKYFLYKRKNIFCEKLKNNKIL